MKRDQFLKTGAMALTGLWSAPIIGRTSYLNDSEPLKPEIVKEFVSVGHNNLERVKEMVADIPNLVFAKHDWGYGDFESAIEGAGHVGNKDIANFLIEKGARVNLFILTMLGKTELVKPILDTYPDMINTAGPHGFTLLHHAKVGREDSKDLFDYLMEKGLTETKIKLK